MLTFYFRSSTFLVINVEYYFQESFYTVHNLMQVQILCPLLNPGKYTFVTPICLVRRAGFIVESVKIHMTGCVLASCSTTLPQSLPIIM